MSEDNKKPWRPTDVGRWLRGIVSDILESFRAEKVPIDNITTNKLFNLLDGVNNYHTYEDVVKTALNNVENKQDEFFDKKLECDDVVPILKEENKFLVETNQKLIKLVQVHQELIKNIIKENCGNKNPHNIALSYIYPPYESKHDKNYKTETTDNQES